jgi:subtilisin family serine protease
MAKKNRPTADNLRLEKDETVLTTLDPKLQSILLAVKAGDRPDAALVQAGEEGELKVEVLAVMKDPNVAVPGLTVTHVVGDVATGTVEVGDIERVRQNPNVISLKAAHKVHADLHISVPEIRAARQTLDAGVPGVGRIDGSGIIVGIVDFGCDFAHQDFLNPDGTTRIKFLWDQNSEQNSMSPADFPYGREFTEADIDAALNTTDPYQHLAYNPDVDAHGTHVMGIAAGNGRGTGSPGVAPNADVIFVELSGGDTSQDESFGNSKRLLEAVAYIFGKAQQLGKPAVVNLSLGTHGGPHDGSTPVERGFDSLLEVPGRAIVISAGNSFERRSHAAGAVTSAQPRLLSWEKFSTDQTSNELEIWYDGSATMDVTLVTPTGLRLGPVALGTTSVIRSNGNEVGRIIHRESDPLNGDNQIDIILGSPMPSGIWGIELQTASSTGVRFDAWIERDDDRRDPLNPMVIRRNQSKFIAVDADPNSTLGSISCGARTIVVGSYNAAVFQRDISAFSSAGPSRDGKQKPEISAPGQNINAPASLSGNGTVDMSGTSMAAPHATGVIALVMQAANRQISCDEIREALRSAVRSSPPQQGSWHPRFGNGRIDALAAVLTEVSESPVAVIAQRQTAAVTAPAPARTPEYHPLLEHLVNSLVNDSKSTRVKVRFELEVEPMSHQPISH